MEVRAKHTRKRKTQKALWMTITKIASQLERVVDKTAIALSFQEIVNQSQRMTTLQTLHAGIIFLTPKQQTAPMEKLFRWVGIQEEREDSQIFDGSMKGTLPLDLNRKLSMQMMHVDEYLKRKQTQFDIHIIAYDQAYADTYSEWETAWEMCTETSAIGILVDVTTAKAEQNLVTKHLHISRNAPMPYSSIKAWILKEEIINKVQGTQLKNCIRLLTQHHDELQKEIEQQIQSCEARQEDILQKQQQFLAQEPAVANKAITLLKTKIDTTFKHCLQEVQNELMTFDKNDEQYTEVLQEIMAFTGFVESKNGKQLTLKISEGALRHHIHQALSVITAHFEKGITQTNHRLVALQELISERLVSWKIDTPLYTIPSFPLHLPKETIATLPNMPDKPYEKQINAKGISTLVMELRTPLFMLMPFMMIFALFGALVGEEDKGHIQKEVLFHQNRPCIAIDRLPESRNQAILNFVEEVDALRDPKKGVFDKEVPGRLTRIPQLAVKEKEVVTFGNKLKTVSTLAYSYDPKTEILYLYLTPYADRESVITTLFDPNHKLLMIPSNTRRSMGIGGLVRMLSGLKEYRYLILISLAVVISWFIISRRKSMLQEVRIAKAREQQKLNTDLKQFVEKLKKQGVAQWKSSSNEWMTLLHKKTLKELDQKIATAVGTKKEERLQKQKSFQDKLQTLKKTRVQQQKKQREQQKLKVKLAQLIKEVSEEVTL